MSNISTYRNPVVGERVLISSLDEGKVPYFIKRIDFVTVVVAPKKQSKKEVLVPIDHITEYLDPEVLSAKEKGDLVKMLVDPEFIKDTKTYYYQLSIFNKILEKYPNVHFWRIFSPGFKVKNLLWWYSGDGETRLKQNYNVFSLEIPVEKAIILKSAKVGEDYVPSGKKAGQSVMDFLR